MWAYDNLGLAAILLMAIHAGNDAISGEVGDDGQSVAIGKGINQDNQRYDSSHRQNVNIYTNDERHHAPNHPLRDMDNDDRLDRLELYMYGDGITLPGVLRQQAEIIRQQAEIIKQQAGTMAWVIVLTAVLVVMTIVVVTLFLMAGG